MATPADVTLVRENTNEPDDSVFTDAYIDALVDTGSVASASAVIWKRKAASYAELVDRTEAGSSLKLSDLHKNALAMAATYAAEANGGVVDTGKGRAKVHRIVRTT